MSDQNILILNHEEQVVGILSNNLPEACGYRNDKQEERLDDALLLFEFECPSNHPTADLIKENGYVAIPDMDGGGDEHFLFQVVRIEQIANDIQYNRIYCEMVSLELNGSIIRPTTLAGVSADNAFDTVLQNTRWKKGLTTWQGTADLTFDKYETVLAGVFAIKEAFGGELIFRVIIKNGVVVDRLIDLVEVRGVDSGVQFTLDQNLTEIKRTVDRTNTVTALIGLGKGDTNGNRLTFTSISAPDKPTGQDWIGDDVALDEFGNGPYHYMGRYETEHTDATVLLNATREELKRRIVGQVTYEVSPVLLYQLLGWEHQKVRIGDTINILDRNFKPEIMVSARVIEFKISYSDPTQSRVILGNFKPKFSNVTKALTDIQRTLVTQAVKWEEVGESISKQLTAPQNPIQDQLWLDTSKSPETMMRWDGISWVLAGVNSPTQIGAETPEGAQTKADTAQSNAISTAAQDATNKANTAQSTAETNSQNYVQSYAQRKIFQQATIPTGMVQNDLWLDLGKVPAKWMQYDGTAWQPAAITNFVDMSGQVDGTTQIKASTITSGLIATVGLDAGVIKFGSMHGDRIQVGTMDADVLKAGTIIASDITFTGTLSGANGTFSGTLNADRVIIEAAPLGPSTLALELTHLSADGSTTTPMGHVELRGNDQWLELGMVDINGVPQLLPVNLNGNLYFTQAGGGTISDIKYLKGEFGDIASSYDEWLRLNDGGTHINGIYCGLTTLRTDGPLQVGPNGSRFYADTTEVYFGNRFRTAVNSEAGRFDASATTTSYLRWYRDTTMVGYIGIPTTTNDNLYLYSYNGTVQFNGGKINTSAGQMRLQLDDSNYILQSTTQFRIYFGGIVKHQFSSDGTKSGGSIEVDGQTLGMSPIDSPQVLLEYVEFNINLVPEGVKVVVDPTWLKTVEHFDVFPNKGELVEVGVDYFVVRGTGKASCRIIGERAGYAGVFYADLDILTDNKGETTI
jgi:phage minor structural protein